MAKVAIGTITDLRGSVEVIHADGSKEMLEQGAAVYADDAITTGDNASARIEFSDDSTMIIGPEFTATLDKAVYDPGLLEGEAASTQVALDSSEREVAPASGHDTTGSGEIVATVETTVGIVEAIDEDGNVRELQAGDTLYANEILSVSKDGDVSIRLVDGSELALGSGEAARMADVGPGMLTGVVDTSVAGIAPAADAVEPAQIAAIIQEGRDPTQEAAAPAAGETGGSNEGAEFTVITPSTRAVTPTSGHETHGFELPFNLPEEELFFEEPEIPVAGVFTASLTGPDNTVNEAGIPTGSLADGSHIDSGTFLIRTTDGIQELIIDPGPSGTPETFTLTDIQNFATANGVVDMGEGILTLTGYTPDPAAGGDFTGTVNYTYELKIQIDNDSKVPQGTDAVTQIVNGNDYFDDTALITLNGVNGSTASDQLVVRALDDNPLANEKPGAIADTLLDESPLAPAGDGIQTATISAGTISGLFAAPVIGADQPGTVGYTLDATDGAKTGLWLTGKSAAADEIELVEVSPTKFEAREGGPAGTLAFTVEINGTTGEVTVTQSSETLEHTVDGPAGPAHDDALGIAPAAGIFVVQTLTDGDGDTDAATSANALNIRFEDDGPDAAAKTGSGSTAGTTLDESPLAPAGDGINPATISAAAIAGLFETPLDYGSDGAGTVEYTLGGAVTGAKTGLWLTGKSAAADEIELVEVSPTKFEAREGGPAGTLAFMVEINGTTGEVTVTQAETLEHTVDGPAGPAHDDALSIAPAAGIFVVQTLTDADGDTDAATSANALDIKFEDDGPVAFNDSEMQTTENAPIVIDAFKNDIFGSDGVDIDNNPDVVVTFTQGGVAGSVVSYDATTGEFTYTPKPSQPAGDDKFTYTITDGDGDTSTAEVTVTIITDSMPVVSVTDGIVDEKGLPAGTGELLDDIGTNNSDPSETTTGTFNINTFNDTLGKLEVKNNVGVFVDVTAATVLAPVTVPGANGVLTVTSDGVGNYSWSYTLTNNLLTHDDNDTTDGDSDRGAADQKPGEEFEVRVTDSDGTMSAVGPNSTINITVYDDGPTLTASAKATDPALSVTATVHEDALRIADGDNSEGIGSGNDEASGLVNTSESLASLVIARDGADEPAALTFGLLSTTAINTGNLLPTLFSKDEALSYSVSDNPTNDVLTATAGGRTVFTLTVNDNGSWDFDLVDQLDHVDDGIAANGVGDTETALFAGIGNLPITGGIDFTAIVTAAIKDADGDVVSNTLKALGAADGSFAIEVENDIPTLTPSAKATDPALSVTATVHEDALRIADGDNSEGIGSGNDEASGLVNTSESLASLVIAKDGADEPGALTFGLLSTTAINTGNLLPTLFSKDEALSYSVSDNPTNDVLTATAGGRTVFTLTVNDNGSWDFDLVDQLDHVDDGIAANGVGDTETALFAGIGNLPITGGIDFTAIVTAAIKDADGDVVSNTLKALGAADGSFAIEVENDIPTLTPSAKATDPALSVTATVHEDALRIADGDNSEGIGSGNDEASGLVNTSESLASLVIARDGADEPGALTFGLLSTTAINTGNLLPTLFSKDEALSYSVSDNPTNDVLTATAGGRMVFTLTVNDNGSWDFDLVDQLDHVDDGIAANGVGDTETALFAGIGNLPITGGIDFTAIVTAAIKDADGDVVSNTLKALGAADGSFAIEVENDIPTLTPSAKATDPALSVTATVHEDALRIADGDNSEGIGSGNDEASGLVNTSESLASLVIAKDGADEPGALTFGLLSTTAINTGNLLPTLFSKDEALSYSVSDNPTNDVLTATAGGRTVFTLTVNDNGSWDFDLVDQLDHVDDGIAANGVGDTETALFAGIGNLPITGGIDFTAIVTAAIKDADGDVVSNTLKALGAADGSFAIEVENDIPTAGPVENQGKGQEFANTNLMLILDTSLSMGQVSDFQGLTGLQVMIKSSLELLDQYDSFGDVKVNITEFSTSSNSSGWVDIADAKAFILDLQDVLSGIGGLSHLKTNYDDALNDAWSSFLTAGKIPDAQNISYFLSDGNPTANTVDGNLPGDPFGNLNGIDASEQAAWEGFLKANQIKSYALGMGKDVDLVNLEPVSYDGIKDEEIPAILVENFADLETTLVSTVVAPALSGDLLGASDSNALIGADEDGWVQSITVYDSNGLNPVVYSYDQNTDTESVTGGPANGVFNPVTNTWAMNTAAGGVLEVDMNTGEYLYEPPAPLVAAVTEVFDYTIVDSDGDAATSTLTLIEDPAVGAAVVRDDFVITNQDPVDIPDAALLANDTPANGSQQQVIGVTAPATDNPDDTVTLGGPDGSFEYTNESTNTSGSTTDTGKVDVDFVTGSILNGGFLDEILIGGSGDETMNGGAGNDVLVAGSGDNILSGGEGDDTFLSMAGDTGTNTISDFKASAVDGGTEEDVLDISDLLVGEEGLNHSTDELLAAALDGKYVSIATETDMTTNKVNTTISLYSDGDGDVNPTPDQVIKLNNFDTTAFAGDSAAMIESLLGGNNLITD